MSRLINFNGHAYNVRQLADQAGLPYNTIWNRLKNGYTPEEAMRQPLIANSVLEFIEADDPSSWDGETTFDVWERYERWCYKEDVGYLPLTFQTFVRQIRQQLDIRLVHSSVWEGDEKVWKVIIRMSPSPFLQDVQEGRYSKDWTTVLR